MAIALPAVAQMTPTSPWMIGARVININPDVSSSVSGFDVKEQWTGEFDTTYFFTPNFAVEGSITWAKQDVNFRGSNLGSLKMMPVTFTAQYHFTNLGEWKRYVAGVQLHVSMRLIWATTAGRPSTAIVGGVQAGFDYQFERTGPSISTSSTFGSERRGA